jgi:chromosome segregation ATPase
MAKALFGHVGLGPDARVISEMRRLRERIRDLEHEVARLEAANAALRNGLQVDDDMLTLSVPDSVSEQVEPALA